MMLAWSPGTDGPVEGEVIAMPTFSSRSEFQSWLPQVSGKFVALSYAEPTCRAPESWNALATPESVERMEALQEGVRSEWNQGVSAAGGPRQVTNAIEGAGGPGRAHRPLVQRMGSQQDLLRRYT